MAAPKSEAATHNEESLIIAPAVAFTIQNTKILYTMVITIIFTRSYCLYHSIKHIILILILYFGFFNCFKRSLFFTLIPILSFDFYFKVFVSVYYICTPIGPFTPPIKIVHFFYHFIPVSIIRCFFYLTVV